MKLISALMSMVPVGESETMAMAFSDDDHIGYSPLQIPLYLITSQLGVIFGLWFSKRSSKRKSKRSSERRSRSIAAVSCQGSAAANTTQHPCSRGDKGKGDHKAARAAKVHS